MSIPYAPQSMEFGLGETADAIRETTARWASDRLAPRAAEIDEKNEFARDLWPEMGDLGLHGAQRRLLLRYPTEIPMYRFFGHFFLGALLLALPSWWLFGDATRLPQTAMQWGVLAWMGLFATALGMYWWTKGSTLVDAGVLAVMNELHVPAGLLVNVLIWNRDTDLKRLSLGLLVIMVSFWLNRQGRRRAVGSEAAQVNGNR